jgi:ABC-2 type transport system ATP-binding protein
VILTAKDEDKDLITLKGVTKRYGSQVVALRNIEAKIRGKVIGLLGPNGAGKSTLLKCMLGLIPFDGEASVLGRSAQTDGKAIRDRVGYMAESDAFLAGMSAVEFCTYAAELSGLPRHEAIQRAHAALYYAGLEEKRYQDIEGYSTGMKQKVKLAQALVHDPDILFLDEPTNGLDPRARDEMLQLIEEMPDRRGCRIIVSTHLLPDVDRLCDHVVIMHQGQMPYVGSIEDLRATGAATSHDFLVEVKSGGGWLGEELVKKGAAVQFRNTELMFVRLPDGMRPVDVLAVAKGKGVQVRGIEVARESMEQAFLRVIGAVPQPAGAR